MAYSQRISAAKGTVMMLPRAENIAYFLRSIQLLPEEARGEPGTVCPPREQDQKSPPCERGGMAADASANKLSPLGQGPYFSTASRAYWEQVGMKRHRGGRPGEILPLIKANGRQQKALQNALDASSPRSPQLPATALKGGCQLRGNGASKARFRATRTKS